MPGEAKENDATARSYKDVIESADNRIEQMRLEVQTAGLTGIAAQSLRFELDLLHDAQEKGRKITPEQRGEIEKLGKAYEEAARQAASSRLLSEAQFDRDQLLRSKLDQKIASQLRGAGLTVDFNSYEAGILRTNEALRQQASAWDKIRSSGERAIDTVFDKFAEGDFSGALSAVAKDFSKTIIDLASTTPIKSGLVAGEKP